MSDRPSDGMGLDELREEFDWISEFQSRMAERICGDADVHNLVDYVGKLESDNDKLRELCKEWYRYARELFDEFIGEPELSEDFMTLEDRLRKMGVEPY